MRSRLARTSPRFNRLKHTAGWQRAIAEAASRPPRSTAAATLLTRTNTTRVNQALSLVVALTHRPPRGPSQSPHTLLRLIPSHCYATQRPPTPLRPMMGQDQNYSTRAAVHLSCRHRLPLSVDVGQDQPGAGLVGLEVLVLAQRLVLLLPVGHEHACTMPGYIGRPEISHCLIM